MIVFITTALHAKSPSFQTVWVKDALVAPCWRMWVSLAKQWAGLHNWYFHTSLCTWREDWQAQRHRHSLDSSPTRAQIDGQTSAQTDTNSPHRSRKTNYIKSCCLVSGSKRLNLSFPLSDFLHRWLRLLCQCQWCELIFINLLLLSLLSSPPQLLRKRHIGNDIVTIIFQEPGALPFTPQNIRSHFQHVFVIVRVHNPCSESTCYR